MPRSTLSIITICRNEEKRIEKTCKSIEEQDFQDFQWIVVDGASTDSTQDRIQKFNHRIDTFISEPDQGIFNAHNKGLRLAQGNYCLFLNGGDELAGPHVLTQVFKKIHTKNILYGDLLVENQSGVFQLASSPAHLNIFYFLRSTIWHPSSFIKTEYLRALGGHDETYKYVADYDFFLKAFVDDSHQFEKLDFPIAKFNLEGVGSSMVDSVNEERLRSQKSHLSSLLVKIYHRLYNSSKSYPFLMNKLRQVPGVLRLMQFMLHR